MIKIQKHLLIEVQDQKLCFTTFIFTCCETYYAIHNINPFLTFFLVGLRQLSKYKSSLSMNSKIALKPKINRPLCIEMCNMQTHIET